MELDLTHLAQFATTLTEIAFTELQAGFDDLVRHLRTDSTLAAIAKEHGPAAALDANTAALASLKKQNKEFVTTAEKRAEQAMRDRVAEIHPTHSVIGEELGASEGDDWLWIFDPVDGTSAMIRTAISVAYDVPLETPQPRFGISIGVVHKDEAVLGVVAELTAVNDHLAMPKVWVGGPGLPASVIPAPPALADAVLVSTVPEIMFNTFETWSGFQALLDATGTLVVDQNCIGFMHLLDGTAHIACERDMALPDAAALVPILTGAGIVVTDHTGNAIRFDPAFRENEYLLLTAPVSLHAEALALLQQGVSAENNRFVEQTTDHGYPKKFSGVSNG